MAIAITTSINQNIVITSVLMLWMLNCEETTMLNIKIPGREELTLNHLVLDYNGIIVEAGNIIEGIRPPVWRSLPRICPSM